jgi:hypothetical protein
LCLLVLILAGCALFASAAQEDPVASQLPIVATPEVVAAHLHAVAALPEAAAELAKLLGVSPQQVRVRMQLKSCITCNLAEHEAASSLEGLPVERAAEQLEADTLLWLFVQDFTCVYTYDGQYLRPRRCELSHI